MLMGVKMNSRDNHQQIERMRKTIKMLRDENARLKEQLRKAQWRKNEKTI